MAVAEDVDAQIPGSPVAEIGQGDEGVLPVGVDGDVDKVIVAFFSVIAGEADGKGSGVGGRLQSSALRLWVWRLSSPQMESGSFRLMTVCSWR